MEQKNMESLDDLQSNKTLKNDLESAQLKIKKATLFCITALIFNSLLLIVGIYVLYFYVKNAYLWFVCFPLLILASSFVGRTLRELLK